MNSFLGTPSNNQQKKIAFLEPHILFFCGYLYLLDDQRLLPDYSTNIIKYGLKPYSAPADTSDIS